MEEGIKGRGALTRRYSTGGVRGEECTWRLLETGALKMDKKVMERRRKACELRKIMLEISQRRI